MVWLIVFAALFVGGHFILSAQPVRDRLVAAVGEARFVPLYSTFAMATFIGFIWAYAAAPYVEVWPQASWARWVPLAVMPLALFLMVGGFSQPNPSAVRQEGLIATASPTGIFAITRHPAMWGMALFAVSHMPSNGDAASLVLFGSLAFLALAGTLHMESRKRRQLGEAWQRFAAATSHVPFAAVASGRARLDWTGIGWKTPGIAIAVFAVLFALHPFVIGVSPLP